MKQKYRLIHRVMLQDIERCMQRGLPEKENVESCFRIAYEYWDKLKGILKNQDFKNESEEINFFRNVKPKFTSYIEYAMLINEALLFVPEEKNDAIDFWAKEINRFIQFYNNNISFILYYDRKDSHYDSFYFLRRSNISTNNGSTHIYDKDPQYRSSHDHLIRTYLAHKMYVKYARKKMWELTGHFRALKNQNGSEYSYTDGVVPTGE